MTESETESFHQELSKAGVYFFVGLIGLFGATMLLAFFNSISYIDADDIFMLVFGTSLLTLAVLLYRYWLNPTMQLTPDELRIRNLFGLNTYPYADIASLGTFSESFRPRSGRHRRMNRISVQKLIVTLRSGKEKTHTLPAFVANRKLLESLSQRSAIPIERLPDVDK